METLLKEFLSIKSVSQYIINGIIKVRKRLLTEERSERKQKKVIIESEQGNMRKAFNFVTGIATNMSKKVGKGVYRQLKKIMTHKENLSELGRIVENLV